MAEQRSIDTYQVPASKEAIVRYDPEATPSQADLARAAIEQAVSISKLDTDDIDMRRVESFGASTVAVAEVTPIATPERYFDPTDMVQLVACGRSVIHLRNAAASYSNAA